MVITLVVLVLLATHSDAGPTRRLESSLFLSLGSKYVDGTPVSQCEEVEVTFGGGVPPYTFDVWSADQQAFTSETRLDAAGRAIWSIQSSPMRLALKLRDSSGGTLWSHPLKVVPGTQECYGLVPVLRTSDWASATSTSSALPTPTSPTWSSPTSLEDCRPKGPAWCKFTPNGQSEIYTQHTLIGNAFANCYSTKPVTQTFTGSTTITDNWSISVGPTFGPSFSQIEVEGEISRGVSRSVKQTFEWEVEPGKQTALVAVGKFRGLFGGMDMNYSNGSKVNLAGVVYFQGTGEAATVTRLDIDCGENWPRWNATTQSNGAAIMGHNGLYGLGVLAVMILIVTLC